jgi:hypothetical protein
MQRDGATSPSRARPAGEALARLASPAHSSRAAALHGRSASQPRLARTRQTPPQSRSENGPDSDCGSSSGKFQNHAPHGQLCVG